MNEHVCAHCGASWTSPYETKNGFPDFCSSAHVDAWMDAHPDEKARWNHVTTNDVVDRMCKRAGLIPPVRSAPVLGDN